MSTSSQDGVPRGAASQVAASSVPTGQGAASGAATAPGAEQAVTELLRRSERALTSSEVAVRLRRPRPEVEAALADLRGSPEVVVCEWPMEDPHFGVDRIVVAARVDAAAGELAVAAAEARCQQVYEDILRDFLASHRCV
jgi:hypothetical protein